MNKGGIEFNLEGIAAQLQGRVLAVPIYQRPYSWAGEPVSEFWSDLRSAFEKKSPEYFLGTIVLTRHTNGRDMIIDGQQRLATTMMVLAAIRNEYAKRGDHKRSNIIQNEYVTKSDLESAQMEPRLRLSSDDDSFFQRLVTENDASAVSSRKSHLLLKNAFEMLQSFVARAAEEAGAEWGKRLYSFAEFIREQARVIILEVPTEADAFLIFETLNDRGADLTIADLLKNYLFGKAGNQIDTVRDGWVQAVGALEISRENSTFTTFLRHFWSSRRGATRERDLYRDIRDKVANKSQTTAFIDDLQQAARFYAALLNSDHDHWVLLGSESRGHVQTFLRLELEQIRPLMLAAMQHFSPAELKKLLKALTSWGVRGLFVGGIGGGTYERAYCETAVKIRKGDIKSTSAVFADLSKIIPTDEEFESAVAVARVPRSNLARYYLIALEKGQQGEKEPELVPNTNEQEVNLEHVLPKNATEDAWGKDFTPDERKDWVFRLGNLALLQKGPNGRIGNKPFAVKKPILAKSSFKQTKEIGSRRSWGPNEIQERQNKLAKLATKVWQRKP
jgi:hypothetical protein